MAEIQKEGLKDLAHGYDNISIVLQLLKILRSSSGGMIFFSSSKNGFIYRSFKIEIFV
jgi:hypothetical protein